MRRLFLLNTTIKKARNMKEPEVFIAQKLLELKAVKLQPNNPFEWNTGWLAPMYFDSRKILSYRLRNIIKAELACLVAEHFPTAEAIAAVAPNAIAIGALVADVLNLPFLYVSPEPKNHGFENRIEGDIKIHQKVVIIADQISWGGSSISVQEALQQDGADVVGLVSLLNYEFEASIRAIQKARLDFVALTSYTALIDKAFEMGNISKSEAEIIRLWHANPEKWSPAPAKRTVKSTKVTPKKKPTNKTKK